MTNIQSHNIQSHNIQFQNTSKTSSQTALYIGRFQPFHNGHLNSVEQIINSEITKIIFGVGSSDQELTTKNPFNFFERKSMIELVMQALNSQRNIAIEFEVLAIPDFDTNTQWVEYIMENLPSFEVVFSGNPITSQCFNNTNIKFRTLEYNKIIKASTIRQKILEHGNWEELVPAEIVQFLISINANNRLKGIVELWESRDYTFNNFDKAKPILIFEKNFCEVHTPDFVFHQHQKNHNNTLDIIKKTLEECLLNYDICNCEVPLIRGLNDYQLIIAVGGDGTFLKIASKLSSGQYIIGVNSDPERSVGGLIAFNSSNIKELLERLNSNSSSNSVKFQKWDRLSAKVNGNSLPAMAVNEVLISKPNIYQTSRLELTYNFQKTQFFGNGIIVATHKGNTAFYKASGGVDFEIPYYGYVAILPFYINGNLPRTKILEADSTLEVSTLRDGHFLIFDSNEEFKYNLKDGDEIEITKNPNNRFNVIG